MFWKTESLLKKTEYSAGNEGLYFWNKAINVYFDRILALAISAVCNKANAKVHIFRVNLKLSILVTSSPCKIWNAILPSQIGYCSDTLQESILIYYKTRIQSIIFGPP